MGDARPDLDVALHRKGPPAAVALRNGAPMGRVPWSRLEEKRMAYWTRMSKRALVSGSIASLASTAALAVLARTEAKGVLQPVNATSHWLNGDRAGDFGTPT